VKILKMFLMISSLSF